MVKTKRFYLSRSSLFLKKKKEKMPEFSVNARASKYKKKLGIDSPVSYTF